MISRIDRRRILNLWQNRTKPGEHHLDIHSCSNGQGGEFSSVSCDRFVGSESQEESYGAHSDPKNVGMLKRLYNARENTRVLSRYVEMLDRR